jgi:multiple sugar transport system permease protein
MVAPAIAGLLFFVAVPFVSALLYSFTDLRMGSPQPTHFVGLAQYRQLLSDSTFRHAFTNNLLFALIVVPVQTIVALALALLLNQGLRGTTILRAAFFLPVVFPMALVAVVWELLLAPGPEGTINALLDTLSFGAWTPRDFLRDAQTALPSIMVLSIWQGTGLQMVILLAGLQSIPTVLYEAARIDGAGPWGRFWNITLPGLRNPLVFVVLITTILAFRLFDQVRILTQGGPLDRTTTIIHEAVRHAFDRQQVGSASAMTVVFFVMVVLVTFLARLLFRERREIE